MRLNPTELSAIRTIDLKTEFTTQYRLSSACDTKVDLLIKRRERGQTPMAPIAR